MNVYLLCDQICDQMVGKTNRNQYNEKFSED
jgi:hypothetical protein